MAAATTAARRPSTPDPDQVGCSSSQRRIDHFLFWSRLLIRLSSSAPSFPTLSAPFSDFSGPGTPGIGGDFSSPGPPPLSYQSELSSALLTPDKPPPHPLAGQVHHHHHHCFRFVLTTNTTSSSVSFPPLPSLYSRLLPPFLPPLCPSL